MECVKPLKQGDLLKDNDCVLDQERNEQSRVTWDREFSAMNSAMACRERHPFFKYLIENLGKFRNTNDVMTSTGPKYLTDRWIEYKRRGEDFIKHPVKIAHPEVFSPLMDKQDYITICRETRSKDACRVTWPYRFPSHKYSTGCTIHTRALLLLQLPE